MQKRKLCHRLCLRIRQAMNAVRMSVVRVQTVLWEVLVMAFVSLLNCLRYHRIFLNLLFYCQNQNQNTVADLFVFLVIYLAQITSNVNKIIIMLEERF